MLSVGPERAHPVVLSTERLPTLLHNSPSASAVNEIHKGASFNLSEHHQNL